VAGRAGRAGYDTAGTVVVQAPDHDVENERLRRKAGDDEKKLRRIVKKKAPDGFVSWGEPTFDRLVAAAPEPLTSSFRVSHAMLLNVIARPGDPFTAMRHLLEENDEPRAAQLNHIKRAIAIYRALLAGGVVQRIDPPGPDGRTVALTIDLQPDFALNQPLSPFAVASLELLDRDSPTYALDALSVLESTLEDPRQVLSAQRNKARGEAVAAMKAEGIEYDERMELLEDVTYPQPLMELLTAAYETYRKGHPWVADYELKPKSVARDMSERAMTFTEYVGHYQLARSEGLVLRYLADSYKALKQTVPDSMRTEELRDLTEWLGELVRQVDSSLLDEWERLASPEVVEVEGVRLIDEKPPAVTSNVRAFRVLVRNAMFRRVELAALRRYDLLGELDAESGFDADAWAEAMAGYYADHDVLQTGGDARGPALIVITEEPGRWLVRQIFDDPAGDHDWGISAVVDLAASDEVGAAAVTLTEVDRLD
jgi:superfamily II RNA helicase